MGRKSLKEERVNQILDAFERCIEAQGLESTTLDNIAEEAGVARRIIRHYIGNRDEVIQVAVDRIIEKFTQHAFALIDAAEEGERFEVAFEYIFSEAFNALPINRQVAALLPASLHDERVQLAVKKIYDAFHSSVDQQLEAYCPSAPASDRKQVAYTVMCLAFGGGWMGNIGFPHTNNELNKSLARNLIRELKEK